MDWFQPFERNVYSLGAIYLTIQNLLGTGKRMFELWIDNGILSKSNTVEIEKCIDLFTVPAVVGRLPSCIGSR